MNSWKTNLINLNSSLSVSLRTNTISPLGETDKKSNFDSSINTVQSLALTTSSNKKGSSITKRLRAFNRATNALGLICNSVNQSTKLSNNTKDLLCTQNNNLLLLQNKKIEDVKSTLSVNNSKNIWSSFKETLTGVKTKNQTLPKESAVKFHYLNNCLSTTKLSLIKYKGRKNGSILNYNKIIGYNFNSNHCPSPLWGMGIGREEGVTNKQSNIIIKNTYNLLFYFFKSMYCLISKPVIKYTNDKVTIQLFYYLNIPKKEIFKLFSILYINSIKNKWILNKNKNNSIYNLNSRDRRSKSSSLFIRWKVRKAISRFKNKNNKNILFNLRKFDLTKVFFNKFKLICEILSNKFNKPVELQLTRLHHPYHDSNILVNLLALNIKNKRKKANWAIKKVYSKNAIKDLNDPALTQVKNIPAFLSGLNIKIAGRLMREPIIPRITTKVFEKGANAIGKVNYLDKASITRKNRKGAYTIKVTSGQNFF